MYFELPECRRCCLCVPLRHGILIFGYLNLLFTLATIGAEIWVHETYYEKNNTTHTLVLYRGVGMHIQLWLAYLLRVVEVIFNVVLVVGAHMKSTRTLHVYYYYGIMTTLSSFLVFIILESYYINPGIIDFCTAFSGIVLQGYLLLLIRSEMKKLELTGSPRYVNHENNVIVDPPAPRSNMAK